MRVRTEAPIPAPNENEKKQSQKRSDSNLPEVETSCSETRGKKLVRIQRQRPLPNTRPASTAEANLKLPRRSDQKGTNEGLVGAVAVRMKDMSAAKNARLT